MCTRSCFTKLLMTYRTEVIATNFWYLEHTIACLWPYMSTDFNPLFSTHEIYHLEWESHSDKDLFCFVVGLRFIWLQCHRTIREWTWRTEVMFETEIAPHSLSARTEKNHGDVQARKPICRQRYGFWTCGTREKKIFT